MWMRQILLSVDGLLHNIIKIKPLLVFTKEDAARLVKEFDNIMKEIV